MGRIFQSIRSGFDIYRQLTGVDPVCIGDDPAGGILTEDTGEFGDTEKSAAHQIGKNIARARCLCLAIDDDGVRLCFSINKR